MAELTNVDTTWQTATVVSTAGNLENAETSTTHDTRTEFDIRGVDEILVRTKSFTLDTATKIQLWVEVADDADEWAYITDLGNDPFPIDVDNDGTRESRAFVVIKVRGFKLRISAGSTGTAGDELVAVDIMRFKRKDA
jgi:hypothetical protein